MSPDPTYGAKLHRLSRLSLTTADALDDAVSALCRLAKVSHQAEGEYLIATATTEYPQDVEVLGGTYELLRRIKNWSFEAVFTITSPEKESHVS